MGGAAPFSASAPSLAAAPDSRIRSGYTRTCMEQNSSGGEPRSVRPAKEQPVTEPAQRYHRCRHGAVHAELRGSQTMAASPPPGRSRPAHAAAGAEVPSAAHRAGAGAHELQEGGRQGLGGAGRHLQGQQLAARLAHRGAQHVGPVALDLRLDGRVKFVAWREQGVGNKRSGE